MVLTRTSARLFGRFEYDSIRNGIPKDVNTEPGQSTKKEISGSSSKIPALNITSQLGRSSPSSILKGSIFAKTGISGKRFTPMIKKETIQVAGPFGSNDLTITAKKEEAETLHEDYINESQHKKAKKKDRKTSGKRKRENDVVETAQENVEITDSTDNKIKEKVKAQKTAPATIKASRNETRNGGKAKEWVRKSVSTKGAVRKGTSKKKKEIEAKQGILEGDKIPKPKMKKAKKLLASLHTEENLPAIQKKASKVHHLKLY